MEKRLTRISAPPADAPVSTDSGTMLKIAEALSAQSENLRTTAETVRAVKTQVRVELDVIGKKIQAVVESVAPRSKVIDVKVTARDSAGRPATYRITVN